MPKKYFEINLTVYNGPDINEWKDSVANIPVQIQKEENEIRDKEAHLVTQQDGLRNLQETQLDPVQHKIEKIDAQIHVITLPDEIETVNQKISPLEKQIDENTKRYNDENETVQFYEFNIKEIQRHIEIKELETEIEKSQETARHNEVELASLPSLLDSKQKLHQAIKSHTDSLVARAEKIKIAKKESNQGNGFSSSQSQQNNNYSSSQEQSQTMSSSNGYGSSASIMSMEIDHESIEIQTELATLINEQRRVHDEEIEIQNRMNRLQQQKADAKSKIHANQRKLGNFSEDEKRLAHCQDANKLRDELSDKVSAKTPHEFNKNKFAAIIVKLKDELSALKRKFDQLTSSLIHYCSKTAELSENKNLEELRKLMVEQHNIEAPLLTQQGQFKAQIKRLEESILTRKEKVFRLEKEQRELNNNTFMITLWRNPETLIENLAALTDEVLNKFEEDHPGGQSDRVLQAMAEIRMKLVTIRHVELAQSTYSDYHGQNIEADQKKYFQMCGLIWHQFALLNQEEDKHFAQALHSILQKNPIAEEYGKANFNALQLEPIPFDQIGDNVQQAYKQAKINLSELLDGLENDTRKEVKDHIKIGRDLIKSIEEKKSDPTSGLLKFHTKILQTAEQLTRNSSDKKLQDKFEKLINDNQDGKPSLCKKIFGIAVMFLSSLTPLSFAFTPPLVAAGICAAGGAGLAIGFGIFVGGRSKGLDNELKKFKNSAKHLKLFAPAPAPSAPPLEPNRPDEAQEQRYAYPALKGA